LEDGWLVIATMRDAAQRQDLFAEEFSEFREQLILKSLDVISHDDRAEIATYVEQEGLDCLVNNAGFALFGALEDCSDAQIRNQMDVNLVAPILLTRAILPALRKRKGSVINVSSVMGFMGFPLSSIYCASKSGLSMWSEALRYELASHDVSVHVVEPGGFRTQFGSNIQWGSADVGAYRTWTQAYHRLRGRLSQGEGKPPTPVVNQIMKIASGKSTALRYRVGIDSVFSGILKRLIPERLRLFFLGRMFQRFFSRS